MDRAINSLGLSNRRRLREEFGYKSIRQAKKDLNVMTDAEAYEIMKDTHNQAVEEFKRWGKAQTKDRDFKKKVIEFKAEDKDKVFEEMKKLAGQSVVLHMMDGNTTIKNIQVDIPANFNNWWRVDGYFIFYYGTDGDRDAFFYHYPNGRVYVWRQNVNVNKKLIKQYFKEGSVNCLLTPIKLWAEDKLENSASKSAIGRYKKIVNDVNDFIEKYNESGVDENAINDIASKLQIDISVSKPLCDKKYIDAKSNKKALKHFRFMNTRCDHTDLNELVSESEYTTLTREELMELSDKLDSEGTFFHYSRDNVSFRKITTMKGVFKLSNDFMEKCNEFEIETGLNFCKVDDIADEELSRFIKSGTHYNATTDFDDIKKVDFSRIKHMDMEKAYTKYMMCKFYDGFLGKITDFRKCNKIMGVGIYQITDLIIPSGKLYELNKIMGMYVSDNVYPSPELKMLESYGCTFKIVCGAWGREPLENIDLQQDFFLEKYDGVSGYAKYIGMCDMHHLEKKTFMRGDENMYSLLEHNSSGKVSMYINGEICVSYPKKSNLHLGHFTSFILAYQRMNALEQLMNIQTENILRICVDGIYYYGDEEMLNCFRDKSSSIKLGNECGDCYVSNIDKDLKFDCGEERDYYGTELHIGEGGNGKTHMNLMDKGLVRPLYVAPSWKLSTKKRDEYQIKSNVWANIYSPDPEKISFIKKCHSCLIIDEVSMMTETQKKFIFETYPEMKLIFCGDVGFQAPSFQIGEMEMNDEGFDKVIEHKKNYRFKCELLIELIKEMRFMISYGRPSYELNSLVKEYLKDRTINHTDIKKMYKINDMILSRTHNIKDSYTNMFPDMEKWYVTKTDRVYQNGQIIIGNKPETTCNLQHAYTIHSIQGETAKHKLFIDVEKNYDSRILYTAISRATTLDQIYLVYDKESAEKNKKLAEEKKKENYKAHWSNDRCDGCGKKVVYCKC